VPARLGVIHAYQPERITIPTDGLLIISPHAWAVFKDAAFIQVNPCIQERYVAISLVGHYPAGFIA